MKKIISYTIILALLVTIYIYRDDLADKIAAMLVGNKTVSELSPNKYYKPVDYDYVQITDDFVAKDRQHLLNIYYTIVNSGADDFYFKCSDEYEECINDVKEISNNQEEMSNLNCFVSPFNSFDRLETTFDNIGNVEIKSVKHYSSEEIAAVEEKMQLINNKITNTTNQREIIKFIHDEIINTTKYDKDRSDLGITKYKSDIAYGPLVQGYALCGGYSDAMALFLDYYDIPNFKVISENHVWNAVKIENKWLHLDLTWDDPVSANDNRDNLEYTFFLIDNKELTKLNTNEHLFDKEVFKEISV